MKDEVESLEKENDKKSEEMEILIASNNSLDEEKLCLKLKLVEESKKVDKVNRTSKKIFKEKETFQKEVHNSRNVTESSKGSTNDKKEEQNLADLKKKLNERQKEINNLKEKNKKLADDLAEEQSKENDVNPKSLILTNLLKTRTAEVKRIEKEKETSSKSPAKGSKC